MDHSDKGWRVSRAGTEKSCKYRDQEFPRAFVTFGRAVHTLQWRPEGERRFGMLRSWGNGGRHPFSPGVMGASKHSSGGG